jgi:hypothetical protein
VAGLSTVALLVGLTTASTVEGQTLLDEQFASVSYNVRGDINATGGANGTPWGGQDVRVAFGAIATTLLVNEWETEVSDATHGSASELVSVTAQADYGSLHVGLGGALTANTNASNGLPTDLRITRSRMTTGQVQARWQDTAVADAAGNPTIVFIGLLELGGNLDVAFTAAQVPAGTSYVFTAASEANIALRLTSSSILTAPYPGGNFAHVAGNSLPGSTLLNQPPTTLIPVQFTMRDGVPYTFDYTLELVGTASAYLGTTSRSPLSTAVFIDADFTHTLRWGGITSATDLNTGLPVTDYTLISSSGFDYRLPAPVPEPAGTMLLGLTTLMLIAHRRRQRGHRGNH